MAPPPSQPAPHTVKKQFKVLLLSKDSKNALNPTTHFEQTFLNELEILLERVTNNVSLVSKLFSSKTKLIINSIVMNNK